MADTIIITLPDQEQIEVAHTVATEVTLRALVDSQNNLSATLKAQLASMLKQSGKSDEEIIKTLNVKNDETKKAIETLDTNTQEGFGDMVDGFKVEMDEFKRINKDRIEQEKKAEDAANLFRKNLGDNFARLGKLLTSLVTQLIAIGSVSAGFFFASFKNLGEGLRQLTDTGQAFGDIQSDQTATTVDTILKFNELGITTGDAVAILEQFSTSAAVLGQSRLPALNKEFLNLTDNGVKLGVALDDATQLFQEDLAFRSSLLLAEQLNQFRNAEASRQSIENLRTFSALLGKNADDLRQQSMSILSQNKSFQQMTVSMGQFGAETQAAALSLNQGLLGAGISQEIINSIFDVASVGVTGINQTLRELSPFASGFRQELINAGMSLRNGTMSMEDVTGVVQKILNSIDTDDPGGLKQLVANPEIGGALSQTAQDLIGASVNARNALRNFDALGTGGTFSEVQNTINEFNNILRLAQGGLSAFRNSIVVGAQPKLAELSALFETTGDSASRFNLIMSAIGRGLGTVFGNAIEKFIGPINRANPEKMLKMIENAVVEFGTLVTNFFEDVLDGFFKRGGELNIIGGITNYFVTVIEYAVPIILKLIGAAFVELFKNLFTFTGLKIAALITGGLVITTLITAMTTAIGLMFAASTPIFQAHLVKMLSGLGFGPAAGAAGGAAAGAAGGAGASLLTKAGTAAKGLGALGGVVALGSDIAQEDTAGMKAGGIGAAIALGLGLALAPFTAGGSLGLAAAAGLGGGGYALGSLIGGDGGKSKDRKEENTEALAQARESVITSPVGFARNELSLGFIREATDLTAMGQVDGMTNQEARQVDNLSTGEKTLIEILAQNKRSNKLLDDIAKKELG